MSDTNFIKALCIRVGPNFENLDFEAHRGTMAVGDPNKLKYQISGL